MFSFGKSKSVVNIVIEDYIIRMVENNGKDLMSIKSIEEKLVPTGIIVDGKIVDELAFYEIVKELVREWNIKNRDVRFYVPDALIILRELDIPNDVKDTEMKQYITMEIGNTIHFPFKNPVFDIYDIQQENEVKKVTVLAAPEEEIIKYTEVFVDASLTPIAVDVRSLGIYRYFLTEQKNIAQDKVYLFFELNLKSIHISIFHKHKLEFQRHQPINIDINAWQADGDKQPIHWMYQGDPTQLYGEIDDHLNEIDRLMNFYRFSIRQGEKSVTDIIMTGDFPKLSDIVTQLKNRFPIEITLLDQNESLQEHHITGAFTPALGLALKGGKF